MANYTWSRTIDNGGTFRSGYAIPAQYSDRQVWKQDAIERTVSTSNQPQHIVSPASRIFPSVSRSLNGNALGAGDLWRLHVLQIFQAYSGSPLPITGSCGTKPAQGTCLPAYNPSFAGPPTPWQMGSGCDLRAQPSPTPIRSPIGPEPVHRRQGLQTTGASSLRQSSRTAPYNLYGPGNYQVDIGLARSFPLHLGVCQVEPASRDVQPHQPHTLRRSRYSVGSHQLRAGHHKAEYNRRSAQLSARIEF